MCCHIRLSRRPFAAVVSWPVLMAREILHSKTASARRQLDRVLCPSCADEGPVTGKPCCAGHLWCSRRIRGY